MFLHAKGKCVRLESGTRELESKVNALTACSEEYKEQRDEETEKHRFLEVPYQSSLKVTSVIRIW